MRLPCWIALVLLLSATVPAHSLLGDLFPLRTQDPYFTTVYQPVIVATVRATRALTHLYGYYRGEAHLPRPIYRSLGWWAA